MILTGLGRIGKDVEVRHTAKGEAVANVSLVFSYGQKGQNEHKPSQWIEASMWGKRAESMAQYLTKGTMVDVVMSEPHIETYQGKNGEGYKLVARIIEIEFAGGNKSPEQKPQRSESKPAQDHEFSSNTDDIPF